MTTLLKNRLSNQQGLDFQLEDKVLLAASNISFTFDKSVTKEVKVAFNKVAKNFWGKLITTGKKVSMYVEMADLRGVGFGFAETPAEAATADADKKSIKLGTRKIKEDARLVIDTRNFKEIGASKGQVRRNMVDTVVHETGHGLGMFYHVEGSIIGVDKITEGVNQKILNDLTKLGYRKTAGTTQGTPTISSVMSEQKLRYTQPLDRQAKANKANKSNKARAKAKA
jgi:hypothetical protein